MKRLLPVKEELGCWMLDTGCWVLDIGCWVLDGNSSKFKAERLKNIF